jgi:hypothetical protein
MKNRLAGPRHATSWWCNTLAIKIKKMLFLTAFKMVDIDCTEVSQILIAGVHRPIRLWGGAPVHPGYNRQLIILLLYDGTFQH